MSIFSPSKVSFVIYNYVTSICPYIYVLRT